MGYLSKKMVTRGILEAKQLACKRIWMSLAGELIWHFIKCSGLRTGDPFNCVNYSQKLYSLGHTIQVLLVSVPLSLSGGDQATGGRVIRVLPELAPESPCYTSFPALPPAPEGLDPAGTKDDLSAAVSTQVTAPGKDLHLSDILDPTENVYIRHGQPGGCEAHRACSHTHSRAQDLPS